MSVIPLEQAFRTSETRNRHGLMKNDVMALYASRAFTSCTILVMCFLDALASPTTDSDRGSFGRFVDLYFPELASGLDGLVPGKTGSDLLYDRYRNGLLHRLGPKDRFAICTDPELDGAWVGQVEVESLGIFTGINVDLLVQRFVDVVQRLEGAAA